MKKAFREHPEIDFVCITAAGVNGTLQAVEEHEKRCVSVRLTTRKQHGTPYKTARYSQRSANSLLSRGIIP